MTTPVLADAAYGAISPGGTGPAGDASPDWRRVAQPIGLGLVVLAGLFYREILTAVHIWIDSTAYNHCFLVIPIVAYLLWDRRMDLDGIAIRTWPAVIPLALPVAMIWLFAERLGIMEGRQIAVVTFVQILAAAVLGRRMWVAISGPLLYLYFLVPFGEFLTPQLQDITTYFVREGLQLIGIPAYIDGYVIEIKEGTFFVAEACAGLRFLIASIAFGCLYALLMYRSPVRRGVFIVASIIVPIIANGFRALGIVYLGHLLNSAQAAAADHLIYGWIFFSLVIMMLIVLGLPLRQDGMTTRSASDDASPEPAVAGPWWHGASVAAMLVVCLAAIGPALPAALAMTASDQTPEIGTINAGPDCQTSAIPGAAGLPPGVKAERLMCGRIAMDVTWQVFNPRANAGNVLQARRLFTKRVVTEDVSQSWLDSRGATLSPWLIMRSEDPAYVMGVGIWVGGQGVRPGLKMRIQMALDSLFGASHAAVVMTVTPAVNWNVLNDTQRAMVQAALPDFLIAHPGIDQSIGALTAVKR